MHQDVNVCEELVSGDPLHDIVDDRQLVLFVFNTFVEREEIRDLSDLAIFCGSNETRKGTLWGSAFFKNSIINHALEFLFACLFVNLRDQIHMVVYRF